MNDRDALLITRKLCDALLQVQALVPELEALADRMTAEHTRHGILHTNPQRIIRPNGNGR